MDRPQSLCTIVLITFCLLAVFISPALASLRICNQTPNRIAIALGHNNTQTWLSEGWWQIDPHECTMLIDGPLPARYYYIYAVDHDTGAEWAGDVSMCTNPNAFTIEGREHCLARGFKEARFREIDTGEHGEWTEYLAVPPIE